MLAAADSEVCAYSFESGSEQDKAALWGWRCWGLEVGPGVVGKVRGGVGQVELGLRPGGLGRSEAWGGDESGAAWVGAWGSSLTDWHLPLVTVNEMVTYTGPSSLGLDRLRLRAGLQPSLGVRPDLPCPRRSRPANPSQTRRSGILTPPAQHSNSATPTQHLQPTTSLIALTMAALSAPARSLFRPSLLPSSILPALLRPAFLLPSAFSLRSAITAQWPETTSLLPEGLGARLRELLPGWVLAVPKSKTTHSAKRMRSANKGLKERQSKSTLLNSTHHSHYLPASQSSTVGVVRVW